MTMTTQKFYPVEKCYNPSVMAIKTGEYRAPKNGERFLSGASPMAYKAYGDYEDYKYYIARIVSVRRKLVEQIEIV